MDDSLNRLHKISAFAAYSGLKEKPNKSVKTVESTGRRRRRDRVKRAIVVDLDESESNVEDVAAIEDLDNERPVVEAKRRKKALNGDSGSKITSLSINGNGVMEPKRKKSLKQKKAISAIAAAKEKEINGNVLSSRIGSASLNQESEGVWKLLNTLTYDDSLSDARAAFAWMINPIPIAQFFEQNWEKKPLHIQRDDRHYYDGLFSADKLDSILRQHDIQYSVNLDITKYENGERKTLNPTGRAYAPSVWNFFKDGCSVRLLNPQTYSEAVWKLNSTMQEFFGTFVGANAYLTPANTQGFAPHYDDIEAFVVQLEGVKRWRVYKPRNDEETLPRFSSGNFKPSEVGKPIMEVELRPGDMMYFPRGFIHQAVASKEEHSLHMTISTTQRNTFGDFMQTLVDQAVQTAMLENVEYRRSLPLNFLDITGTVNMDKKKKGRKDFVETAKRLLTSLVDYASIDGAADQMAKTFMQDSLPPCLTEEEKRRSIHGQRKDSSITLGSNTKVRLIRKHCIRLVMEDEAGITVYYNTENSRIYREKGLQHFIIEEDVAPGVDYLTEMYPKFVAIKDFPMESEAEKIRLCQLLYEKALLMTE